MRRNKWLWSVVAGVLLGSGAAFAQVDATEVAERLGADLDEPRPLVSLQALGGLSEYTGDLGARTDLGASFGVMAAARAYDLIGVEATYRGNRNEVSEDFAGNDPGVIFRHSAQTLIKVGPDIQNFVPFVGAGLGASLVDVTDAAEANDFSNDFIIEFPFAAGLEYQRGPIAASIRGTYEMLVNEDFADDTGNEVGGGALSALATVGGSF